MPNWLLTVGAVLGSVFLLLVLSAALVVYMVSDESAWQWASVAVFACGGVTLILLGRSRRFARAFMIVSDLGATKWEESYQADYKQTTSVYPGPVVAGILVLVGTAVCVVLMF